MKVEKEAKKPSRPLYPHSKRLKGVLAGL